MDTWKPIPAYLRLNIMKTPDGDGADDSGDDDEPVCHDEEIIGRRRRRRRVMRERGAQRSRFGHQITI